MNPEERNENPTPAQLSWYNSLLTHYQLANQLLKKVPAGETMSGEQGNKILDLMEENKNLFLFLAEICFGHKVVKQPRPGEVGE